jgi:conjugative transfer signal peptidase TraF
MQPYRTIALAFLSIVFLCTVRLNVSPSVPYGFYLRMPLPSALSPGTLVLLPVPAPLRFAQTIPLLKPVAAIAGETVCVTEDRLVIGTVDYGLVSHEAHGHPLPSLEGCTTIAAGEVFLASHAPRSLDSRYFGPVPITTLSARAIPLLTWR